MHRETSRDGLHVFFSNLTVAKEENDSFHISKLQYRGAYPKASNAIKQDLTFEKTVY